MTMIEIDISKNDSISQWVKDLKIKICEVQDEKVQSRLTSFILKDKKFLIELKEDQTQFIRLLQVDYDTVYLSILDDQQFHSYQIRFVEHKIRLIKFGITSPKLVSFRGQKPIKNFTLIEKGQQILLLIVMGSYLQFYLLKSSVLLLKLRINLVYINVKQILWNEAFGLVTVLGQNYHGTFSVITIIKVFGQLNDDKGLKIFETNSSLNYAISRSGIYDRYFSKNMVFYNEILLLDATKNADVLFQHDDFMKITHGTIFTKDSIPFLMLGNNIKKEIYVVNIITLLQIQKYNLAPEHLKFDDIQEVIPIQELQAFYPILPFLDFDIKQDENKVILHLYTQRQKHVFFRITDSFNLMYEQTTIREEAKLLQILN